MKKILIVSLVLIVVLAFSACVNREVKAPNGEEPGGNVVVDPDPKDDKVEVTLYFMNEQYILTGDETLEKAIAITREVVIGEKTVEEVILEELQKRPEEENLTTSMENIKVLGVEVKENTAYVNLSSEELHGGSLEETSILTQMVLSLTELPEIDEVQIYVDGTVRETLMSHYEIMEPLSRKDFE